MIRRDHTTRSTELSNAVQRISDYYKYDIELLVNHLYTKHNYTVRQVGEILGITPQAVSDKYPKEDIIKKYGGVS